MRAVEDSWRCGPHLAGGVFVVGMGGNLGGHRAVQARFKDVVERCNARWGLGRVSLAYVTKPMGEVLNQPDFLNAAAAWHPSLDQRREPEELLLFLQELEQMHHRERQEKGGARTLDLDLLFVGTQTCDTKMLQLPHPRIASRRFVLQPLCDLFGESLQWPGETLDLGDILKEETTQSQAITLWCD